MPSPPESPPTAPNAYLLLEDDDGSFLRYFFTKPRVLIGRGEDNDIVIRDEAVLPRHAEIFRAGVELHLVGVAGGESHINGGRLEGVHPLRNGDVIRLGGTVLLFAQESRMTDTALHLIVERRADVPLGVTVVKPVVRVGRSKGDVLIDDDGLSPTHLIIENFCESGVFVLDARSTSGTLLNGRRLEGRRRLGNGDTLTIGSTRIHVSYGNEAAGRPAARTTAAPEAVAPPPRPAPPPALPQQPALRRPTTPAPSMGGRGAPQPQAPQPQAPQPVRASLRARPPAPTPMPAAPAGPPILDAEPLEPEGELGHHRPEGRFTMALPSDELRGGPYEPDRRAAEEAWSPAEPRRQQVPSREASPRRPLTPPESEDLREPPRPERDEGWRRGERPLASADDDRYHYLPKDEGNSDDAGDPRREPHEADPDRSSSVTSAFSADDMHIRKKPTPEPDERALGRRYYHPRKR